MSKAHMQDPKTRRQIVNGASLYADADKSDPFAFNRAMAHARQGMVEPGDYDAEPTTEPRAIQSRVTGKVETYNARTFRSVKRL